MEAKTLKEGIVGRNAGGKEREERKEVLTNQQLDEEIGRAEEREEWRTQQWLMTRKEELFNEAMRTAEMVGEQMAAKLSEDGV